MQELNNITDVIYKHLQELPLSSEEQSLFDQWLASSPANQALLQQLSNEQDWWDYINIRKTLSIDTVAYEKFKKAAEADSEEYNSAHNDAVITGKRAFSLYKWGWAAACVLLIAGIGIYLYNNKNSYNIPVVATSSEIQPGKGGAILTLSDGRQVVLDSLGNGVIATQNGTQILLKNGQLAYDPTEKVEGAVVFNTITTPKGREFQVVLPDGTRVWVNAGSSLRYPIYFNGSERRVEVTGEAYFEVAKNAKMPFKVAANRQAEIEVLGTQFNVNAYTNQKALTTTLLEGLIKVNGTLVNPGQQAQLINNQLSIVKTADIEKVMAWKNGLFNFDNTPIEEVMTQLERWYDIEVVYQNGVPDVELMGKMTKDVSLNGLLKVLHKLGVHYTLEGRKLIILP